MVPRRSGDGSKRFREGLPKGRNQVVARLLGFALDEAGIPPAHAEVFSARLRAKGGNNFLRHRIDKGLRRGLKDLRAGIAASEIHAIIAALIREHGPERAAAMFHRLRLKEIHAWATRARSKPRKKVPKPSPARRLPRKPR